MRMLPVVVLLGAVALGSYVSAQDQPVVTSKPRYTAADVRKRVSEPPATFDVVSLKPLGDTRPQFVPPVPGVYNATATARALIRTAFDLPDDRITGGPEWLGTTRYVLNAKAAAPFSTPTLRTMLRRLLEDRFRLRTHTESREMPVYTLTVRDSNGRLGAGMKAATLDCRAFLSGERPTTESPMGPDGRPACLYQFLPRDGSATIRYPGGDVAGFAKILQGMVGRPVIDRTGLTGPFDITLSFDLSSTTAPVSPGAQAEPPTGPAILTALQEQLGLRAETARAPLDVLVIDGAELPTPD